MRRSGHDHEFVGEPRHHDDVRRMTGSLDESHIGAKLAHGRHDIQSVADAQIQTCGRVQFPIPRQHRGKQIVADGGARVDLQIPERPEPAASEGIFDLVCAVQDGQRRRQQGAPGIIEEQTLAHPVEQIHPQDAFQFVDRRTGRRLREGNARGCRTRAPVVCDALEDLQLPQGEAHSRPCN